MSLWYPLRYWIQRQEGYRLIFAASIAGGFLLFLAQLLLFFFSNTPYVASILTWWQTFLPVQNSDVGVLAFILAFIVWGVLEAFSRAVPALRPNAVRRRYISASNNAFEQMLFRALETQETVSITLKSNKVYIGRIATSFNLVKGVESIRLSLEKSGYRKADTHELNLNVDYAKTHIKINERIDTIYEAIIQDVMEGHPESGLTSIMAKVYEEAEGNNELRTLTHNFEVVLIASEIVSIAPFDPELFDAYFKPTDL